jgi:PKD repeat protein
VAQPGHSANQLPIQICWNFGDGHDTCITAVPGTVLPLTITHTYVQPGIYNVCIKIKYHGNCVAEKCKPVTVGVIVHPDSCRANFETSLVNSSPLLRKYTALPLHSNGKKPQQICWKFGDGRDTCISYTENHTGLYNVQHQYQQPGVYTVCIKIKYFGGCIAEYCRPVTVAEAPCRALFTDSMISRFKVKFKGQAIIAQPNNPVVSWQWTFGDGSAGTGQNVIHEYAHPGRYNVCLKITTANGCQNTYCRVKVIDSGVRILQLHPNPVINTLYITYYSFRNEQAQIKIYNVFGVLVRTFIRQMTVGYNNFSTDVSTLPPGPYSLVVQTPTTIAASVFFKQ